MDVMLIVNSKTPAEWKAQKTAVWFYLEDAAINPKDFTMIHSDRGFMIKVHEHTAARARSALRNLIEQEKIDFKVQPVVDNPEIVPVKKKKRKMEKISNIKIKTRDDVAVRESK